MPGLGNAQAGNEGLHRLDEPVVYGLLCGGCNGPRPGADLSGGAVSF
jgi:hypothetical protein